MSDTIQLSHKEEFKNWMREFKSHDDSTITTRVNNVERIEHAYGSLADQWKKDRFESLFDQLKYSKTDELLKRKYTGPLEINGDLYNNLATYRAALQLYSAFLSAQKLEKFGYPFGDIGEKVHIALERLNSTCKKKKSYKQKEVKELIISPLVNYLNDELSTLGYKFSTETVATINNDKKQSTDRYDIYGEAIGKPIIIIEVDTHRADQVAKKVVSRLSFNLDAEVLYVALVYPNNHQNKNAEKKECMKYFRLANDLFSIFTAPQKHFVSHWLFK